MIGCVKLFHTAPSHVREETDILGTLFSLLASDPDPNVVMCALLGLNEILEFEGGFPVRPKSVVQGRKKIMESFILHVFVFLF